MPEYRVTIPVSAWIQVTVLADDEDDALDHALRAANRDDIEHGDAQPNLAEIELVRPK